MLSGPTKGAHYYSINLVTSAVEVADDVEGREMFSILAVLKK